MLMRWIRKIVVVGLALFGARRLFEAVRLRVAPVKDRATPHLHDAADHVTGAAHDLVDDVAHARHVVENAAQDVLTDLGDAAHEVKVGAEAVAHDIKSVVVPPPPTH